VFAHNNFTSLWKAGLANDVASNLIGSATVTVTPDQSTMTYKIEMIDDLRMESATRAFQKKEGTTMEGLVSSHERTDKDALNIGGTLRCSWEWEEQLL
jgi:hypothetical protein